MKKTFTTTMPDQVGAFLKADACISRLNLNITRVSYNKAVDTHMLFIEVDGDEDQLQLADKELEKLGYLHNTVHAGNVILMEFKLQDQPGTLLPVLTLINQFNFNISYISSQENNTPYQYFKMGLFVDDSEKISEFMQKVALLCPVRIIDYDKREKLLDNTVFYLNFSNDISEKMGLDDREKHDLIVNSNQIMQALDDRNSPPYKTFDYIGRFVDSLRKSKGDNFTPRITHLSTCAGMKVVLIEPPCGSNICVLECEESLLIVDTGFAYYEEEQRSVLNALYPDFEVRRKAAILTHADVDHCGCLNWFDTVYVNQECYENFAAEKAEVPALREENPLHAPYVRISKILSAYRSPDLKTLQVIGDSSMQTNTALSARGKFKFDELEFELYVGAGGHVKGEMVLIERTHRIVFTGDIFVNIKGFTDAQAKFNRIAPYLMTSVDTDPVEAKVEREAIFKLLSPGKWQIFSGHGAVCEREIVE